MPEVPSLTLRITSYLVAAAAGWFGVSMMPARNATVTEVARTNTGPRAKVVSRGAEEILARLAAKHVPPRFGTDGKSDFNQRLLKSIAELSPKLKPAEDRAVAARDALTAMSKLPMRDLDDLESTLHERAEANVRLLQWIESEPEAALAFMKEWNWQGPVHALQVWSGTAAAETVLEQFSEKSGTNYNSMLSKGLGANLGQAGDIAAYASLKDRIPVAWNETFCSEMASRWPKEKLKELIPLATEQKNQSLLAHALRRLPEAEVPAQLAALMSDEDSRQMTMKVLGDPSGATLNAINANQGIPIDERVALVQSLNPSTSSDPEKGKREAVMSVAVDEMKSFAKDAEMADLIDRFRAGETDGRDIIQSINAALPTTGAMAPEVVRATVFQILIQEDPARAAGVFQDATPKERYEFSVMAAAASDRSPQQVFDLLSAVPYDSALGTEVERLKPWTKLSREGYDRYGEDYVEWVKALPAGAERDRAIKTLVTRLAKEDPKQAADLRDSQNPTSKAR